MGPSSCWPRECSCKSLIITIMLINSDTRADRNFFLLGMVLYGDALLFRTSR